MSGATLQDIAVSLFPDRWGMTANEKSVLVQLCHAADYRTDNADVGLPRVARQTGLSIDTVRRCIRALADGGWLAILPQDRPNGATSTNCYPLNYEQIVNAGLTQKGEEEDYRAQWRERFANTPPRTVQGGAGSTMQGGPSHGARGKLSDNNSISTLSDAQAREAFIERVKDAAGEAPDPVAPGIIAIYPLLALMACDSPCSEEEVIEGVRKAAAWYAARGWKFKMRNWDMAVKMALEFRDLRIAGHPVKEPAKPKPPIDASAGEPKTWTVDRWKVCILVAKRSGWPEHWGPPPGEDGSYVPAELVDLWKGEVA